MSTISDPSTATSSTTTTATATANGDRADLTPDAVERFHRDGFLAPLTLCSPAEMAEHRAHIDELLQQPSAAGVNWPGRHNHCGHNRHLDDAVIWHLASHPAVVDRMRCILGDDLYLWRTNFFDKPPGGKEIPWHQDRNYWPLEPEIVCSAWLAIDAATVENSCVQVIPGSHRRLIEHVPAPDRMQFAEMADPAQIDLDAAVDLELEPGQFILFNERTLHHSFANRSDRRRLGLAIRVIVPQVRVLEYDGELHRLVRLSGGDRLGFNEPVHERAPVVDRA